MAVCAGLLVLGRLRPRLFGADYTSYLGQRQRSYDEQSLIRLGWFFSQPGLLRMLFGIGHVAWSRWRLDRWLVVLVTAGLLTLYWYHCTTRRTSCGRPEGSSALSCQAWCC